MCRRIIGFELFCLAFSLLSHHAIAGGVILTSLQTQSAWPSGTLVDTDWGRGLIFDQFNPKLGTLNSIDITLTATVRNEYELIFSTPSTLYVATSQTTDPRVLADPTERANLTDGPTVTLFGPNGTTQIFGAPATRQPVDLVQLTEPSGTSSSLFPITWSSLLSITDPHFIPPTETTQSFSRTLTDENAHLLFSEFIGPGNVDLSAFATAFSSFYSSSGNGSGGVTTTANASVTIQYAYTSVPEPSSLILWLGMGLGIGISFLASSRLRRRAACASQSDRT